MSVELSKNNASLIISEITADLFNNINTGVFVFGEDKSLKDINAVSLKIINSVYPEINSLEVAKELTLDKIFNESNFPGWYEKFEIISNNSGKWISEYLTVHQNDQIKIIAVRAGNISTKSGEHLFVVIYNDVTDEKKSQHRLAWIEKQSEKGCMASIIVHDLNNYLSLLLGGAELAGMMLDSGKIEKAVEKLEKLKDNVKKMEKFIAGFTDEYKIETNKQRENLNRLITNVVSYLSTRDKFINISIDTHLDSKIPEFEFDTDQISRLLLNLFDNSADAIETSGISGGQISIKTKLIDTNIQLTVADNGPGLTPDVKEKLFKRRFTTKENHTGYGLMVCGCIVENHFGQVEIIDDTKVGTAFKILLPVE